MARYGRRDASHLETWKRSLRHFPKLENAFHTRNQLHTSLSGIVSDFWKYSSPRNQMRKYSPQCGRRTKHARPPKDFRLHSLVHRVAFSTLCLK